LPARALQRTAGYRGTGLEAERARRLPARCPVALTLQLLAPVLTPPAQQLAG